MPGIGGALDRVVSAVAQVLDAARTGRQGDVEAVLRLVGGDANAVRAEGAGRRRGVTRTTRCQGDRTTHAGGQQKQETKQRFQQRAWSGSCGHPGEGSSQIRHKTGALLPTLRKFTEWMGEPVGHQTDCQEVRQGIFCGASALFAMEESGAPVMLRGSVTFTRDHHVIELDLAAGRGHQRRRALRTNLQEADLADDLLGVARVAVLRHVLGRGRATDPRPRCAGRPMPTRAGSGDRRRHDGR